MLALAPQDRNPYACVHEASVAGYWSTNRTRTNSTFAKASPVAQTGADRGHQPGGAHSRSGRIAPSTSRRILRGVATASGGDDAGSGTGKKGIRHFSGYRQGPTVIPAASEILAVTEKVVDA